jgi:hypothetical protein
MFRAAFSHTPMSAVKSRAFDVRQRRVDEGLVLKPRTQFAGALLCSTRFIDPSF